MKAKTVFYSRLSQDVQPTRSADLANPLMRGTVLRTTRSRISKYHTRNTSDVPFDFPDQSGVGAVGDRRSLSKTHGDKISFHHHQHHHHNYYVRDQSAVHSATSTSHSSSCSITGCIVFAILFLIAYYFVFSAMLSHYGHFSDLSAPNGPSPPRRSRNHHLNVYEQRDARHRDERATEKLREFNRLLSERRNVEKDEIGQNPANSPDDPVISKHPPSEPVSASDSDSDSKRRRRQRQRQRHRHRHRQEVRKLRPFPAMYLSDNPYFTEQNLLILGQVSNAEKRIDIMLYQLESVGCLFNSTTFLLFESNSEDNTLLHLQRWSLRRPLNCEHITFRPDHYRKYQHLRSLHDVIALFRNDNELEIADPESAVDEEWINGLIIDFLKTHYATLKEVDLYVLSQYLSAMMGAIGIRPIEMEEVLYRKLEALKFAKYYGQIEGHHSVVNKRVLSGDQVVEDELAVEREILRQLKVYGSLNELHSGYNVMDSVRREQSVIDSAVRMSNFGGSDVDGESMAIFMDEMEGANRLDVEYAFLAGIKREEMRRVKHSDFVDEFEEIHHEIEGLIQYDEGIIHEKLRERKRKYEQRRKQDRERREQQMAPQWDPDSNGNGDGDSADSMEEPQKTESSKFRDRLFRIERFVIYRNMLLDEARRLSDELRVQFAYILMIDLDVFSIDVRTLLNELYFMPRSVDGLCVDGIDWMGFTRDTFATVKVNGGWLHYGHDALVNSTEYVYNNQHAMHQRTKVPDHEERYEEVKSCFGGVMVYRNERNRFLEQQCRYTLTRDVFFTEFNNTESPLPSTQESVATRPHFNYSYDWWLRERWHNDYSEQSRMEMKLFVEQYVELLQVFDVTLENRELIPRDGDICEHIPFHYCLWDRGFKFAISTRAQLFYDQFYPIDRNDTNWQKFFATRPAFTL